MIINFKFMVAFDDYADCFLGMNLNLIVNFISMVDKEILDPHIRNL